MENREAQRAEEIKTLIIMNRSRCNGYDSMGREFIEELEREYLEESCLSNAKQNVQLIKS